jgi:hypothetical protein
VRAAAERDEHAAGARVAGAQECDVGRRPGEEGLELGRQAAGREVAGRCEHDEIDTVVCRQAQKILSDVRRRECGAARRHAKEGPSRVEGLRRLWESTFVGDDARDEQLAAGRPSEQLCGSDHVVETSLVDGNREDASERTGPALGSRRRLERGVLPQDLLLELAQRRRGLETELVEEARSRPAVRLESVGLPASAVQRQHQLGDEALVQRVLSDKLFELGYQRRVSAECQLGVEQLLQRFEPDLLEPLDRRPGERLVGEICERRPAPDRQRVAKQVDGAGRVAAGAAFLRLGSSALEVGEVELVRRQAEDISRRPGLDRSIRAERFPQIRDLPLNLRDRSHGWPAGVERIGEDVDGDHPVGIQKQDGQRRPLFLRGERDECAVALGLERPEDPETEHRQTVIQGRSAPVALR